MGVGHIEFEYLGGVGQFSGGSPGEGQATPGPGEDDLGALLLGVAGHPEGEGRIRENAGDQDSLTVEKRHGCETAMRAGALLAWWSSEWKCRLAGERHYGVPDAHRNPWWYWSGG